MAKYSVAIIGGGPAGLTTALTLASANGKFPFVERKRYLVIYGEYSDLDKALLKNVPAVKEGTLGKELLQQIREQVSKYENVDLVKGVVKRAEGEKGNFKIYLENGETFEAEYLVLATGFHKFEIEGLNVEVIEHHNSPRPNKVMLKHSNNKVREGIYVAGLLAGEPTMYASASGSGSKVACDILSEWAGKIVVVHDVPEES